MVRERVQSPSLVASYALPHMRPYQLYVFDTYIEELVR